MALPNPEEKVAIQKLKERVTDILGTEQLNDDFFLVRWLRARELNLDKAEGMLRNSMKWRAENEVDKVLQKPVDPYFGSNYPFNSNGKDREGRPLVILPLGKWDARMAVEDGKIEQLVSYITFFFESIMKAIRESGGKPGHPNTQFSIIVDWDGYSFKQFTNIKAAKTVLNMSVVYEAHYPEILSQAIFINSTPVFQMLWSLMKKVLAERTVGKIQVYGTNRKDWEPAIARMVEVEKLGVELHEGHQISDEELKKLKEAQGLTDEDISSLIIR